MAKKWPEMVVQRSFIKEHSFPYRLYGVVHHYGSMGCQVFKGRLKLLKNGNNKKCTPKMILFNEKKIVGFR